MGAEQGRAGELSPRARAIEGFALRHEDLEITNVDFSLRHFLLPLMRAIARRRA